MKIGYRKELKENYKTYVELADFTDGRIDKVSSYLISYLTERDSDSDDKTNNSKAFNNRKEHLYNINYCSPYLFIHLGHLTQEITIQGYNSEKIDSIKSDVDLFNNNLKCAYIEYMWDYLRDGMVGVLVDKEPLSENITEATNKARSYQLKFEAVRIRNIEYYHKGNNRGKLRNVYLTLSISKVENEDKKFKETVLKLSLPEVGNYTWEYLESKDFNIDNFLENEDIEFESIYSGTGSFEEIPFSIIGGGVNDSMLSEGMPLNKALLNKRSIRGSIIYNQGFQRNFIFGVEPKEIIRVGEHLLTAVKNENAKILSLEAGTVDASTEEIKDIQNQVDRRLRLEFNQLADDTRQIQSAESKQADRVGKKKIYSLIIDQFQSFFTNIYRFHFLFDDPKAYDPKAFTLSIAKDFELDDLSVELSESQVAFYMAKDLGVIKVQKAILKYRISRLKFLPEDDLTLADTYKLYYAEIDKAEKIQEVPLPDIFRTLNK